MMKSLVADISKKEVKANKAVLKRVDEFFVDLIVKESERNDLNLVLVNVIRQIKILVKNRLANSTKMFENVAIPLESVLFLKIIE